MSLRQTVENEKISQSSKGENNYSIKGKKPMIYSQKLGGYVPLDSGNTSGKIQKYNIGMGPGSWY